MAAPTTIPEWATGATAEKTEPPADIQSTGFTDGYPPPHEYINWFWNLVSVYLKGGGVFDSPEAAYAALDDGGKALVWDATTDAPLTVGSAVTLGTSMVPSGVVACDGVYVYVGGLVGGATTPVYQFDRSLSSTTQITTYTPANTGLASSIDCDGEYVAVANTQYVDLFTVDGTLVWTYDHGGTVYAVKLTDGDVIMVGEEVTNISVRRLSNASGTVVWEYDHGEAVYGLAVALPRVFIYGDASAHATGAQLRCLVAATGAAATTEGGTAADTTGIAWDDATARSPNPFNFLATDGKRLFLIDPATSPDTLEVCSITDGESLASRQVSLSTALGLTVDDRHVYVSTYNSSVSAIEAFDKDTLNPVGRTATVAGTITGNTSWPVSDGASLFWLLVPGSGPSTSHFRRVTLANPAPRLWERTDHTVAEGRLPWRRLINPIEVD